MTRLLFVVGTGRSGTHFLTRCLIAHPGITDLADGRERPRVFANAVRVASGNQRRGDQTALVWQYRWLRARARTPVVVDQSHPNLWNYDLLRSAFPDATFLALVRDPRAVVASMLQHEGVRTRTENWAEYPFPSRFLGVTEDNVERFSAATLAGRCAFRWLSHTERILELAKHGGVAPIRYEYLVERPREAMGSLFQGLGLPTQHPDQGYRADPASTRKWARDLSEEQVAEVLAIADEGGARAELGALLDERERAGLLLA